MMSYSKGLEGVIAGETAISQVEGDIGRLTYRGYTIESLVQKPYLSVMWLVLFGEFPDDSEYAELDAWLKANGSLTDADLARTRDLSNVHPMQAIQGVLPLLEYCEDYRFGDLDESSSRGLAMIAKMPLLIGTLHQYSQGNRAPAYNRQVGYLENFLAMFTGGTPSAQEVEVLKIVQILQMEHSFNAGTFATRVVASTLAPVESVFSAGIGTLAGILHGGADEAALLAARAVGTPENASGWIDALLEKKGKLMGMGHREYKTVDPRSKILKPIAQSLCEGTASANTFATLEAMEEAFGQRMSEKGKPVKANLEFYKGAVYEVLGIPPHFFTSVFAMSRMIGWLAHYMEQSADNRIVRPKALYVGKGYRAVA